MLPKGRKSKAPWDVWTDIADQLAFPLSCPLIYHDSVLQVKITEGERSSQNGTEIPSLVEVCINSRAFLLLLLLLVDVFQFLDSYTKKSPM
jgi:hypothetical protein